MATNSNLLDVCKAHGYHVEPQINFDGSIDNTTMVVEFPCKVPETTPIAGNFSWKEQIDVIRRVQREWSDNAVSCTVTYNLEDLEDIKEYLKTYYKDEIKTISFLLYQNHGFKQAPYETISKERYEELIKNTKPITSITVKETDFDVLECENGACPIK